MRNHIEIDPDSTIVTIELKSRDDLERCINWLPGMRVLFPYPPVPPNPEPGNFVPGNIPSPTSVE